MKIWSVPLLCCLVCSAFANDFVESRDIPLQRIVYKPRNIPSVTVNQGFLKLDTYRLKMYPYVIESLDHSQKALRVVIDLFGPSVNVLYRITFAVDGKVIGPNSAAYNESTGSGCNQFYCWTGWDTGGSDVAPAIRALSGAHEVYMTFTGDGAGRISFKLSEKQLELYRTVMMKYDSIQVAATPAGSTASTRTATATAPLQHPCIQTSTGACQH